MVDSEISVHCNKQIQEVTLTKDLEEFKLDCQETFNLTDKQLEEMNMKYKDPDEETGFIRIDDQEDYETLLENEDFSDIFLVIEIIVKPPIKQITKSTFLPGVSEINDEKLVDLKRSIIDNQTEGIKSIKKMKEESNNSINDIKGESTNYMNQMKDTILNEIRILFDKQQTTIIEHLNTKLKMFEIQKSKTGNLQSIKTNSSISNIIHEDIVCNECNDDSFSGHRYMCHKCSDYNLCQNCFEKKDHEHLLYVIKDSTKMPMEILKKVKKSKTGTSKANQVVENDQNEVKTKQSRLNNSGLKTNLSMEKPNENNFANKNLSIQVNEDIVFMSEFEENNNVFKNKEKIIKNDNQGGVQTDEEDDIDYEKLYKEIDEEYNVSNSMVKQEVIKLLKLHKGDVNKVVETIII